MALGTVLWFLGMKIILGLVLLKVSTVALSVEAFSSFSQLFLVAGYVNMLSAFGAQNALVQMTASARDDTNRISQRQGAAIAIWAGTAAAACFAALIARSEISLMLIGDGALTAYVVPVVGAALLSGPGQIYCALLTGRGRSSDSMVVQGLGLLCGSIAAVALLLRGDAAGAVLAFAGGGIVTSVLAASRMSAIGLGFAGTFDNLWLEAKALLRFSLTFVVTASFAPLSLFAVRALYRDHFGIGALGHLLVASRISDTTTQLVGLVMVQLFIPGFTRALSSSDQAVIIRYYWFLCAGLMGSILGIFCLAPEFFISIALSSKYISAIPEIRLYMIGDVFRVSSVVMMYAAFSKGWLARFMLIEFAMATAVALTASALILLNFRTGPFLGYMLAHITATAVFIMTLIVISIRAKRYSLATAEGSQVRHG